MTTPIALSKGDCKVEGGGCMMILHYVTAIKINFSLIIIVNWHFVPFSRHGTFRGLSSTVFWHFVNVFFVVMYLLMGSILLVH